MNEGQYDSKNVEHISIENIEVVSNGMDWKSRHLEAEKRKAEIRDRIHKQTEQGQKSAKDYFRPAKPTPSIYDSDLKRVAVYARVSTSSEEQISSIENQTLYYTKKIAETENWNLQDIYSDEGKSGTSLRKRDAFKRMMRDAKDQKHIQSSVLMLFELSLNGISKLLGRILLTVTGCILILPVIEYLAGDFCISVSSMII